jgi:hypothetical protein
MATISKVTDFIELPDTGEQADCAILTLDTLS